MTKKCLGLNGVKGQSDLNQYIYTSGYATVSNNYAKNNVTT